MHNRRKIMITGGHVTPALSVIDELKTSQRDISIVFVGKKYNNERERTISFEFLEVSKRHIPFVQLSSGRFTRIINRHSLINILKVPFGFFQAFQIMSSEKPSCVLSFGGYLALPIVVAAWMYGIPTFTHEQTIRPGFANRFISKFVKKIFISFTESASFFPNKKVVFTGNPLRKSIFEKNLTHFKFTQMPCIYITGGSLGSHSINVHIEHILNLLLQKYMVIHQTGNLDEYGDLKRLTEYRNRLPSKLQNNYYPVSHILDNEIGAVLHNASLVISRSGANTCFELLALKKISILIPLPWSGGGEQILHAKHLETYGIAEVFHQHEQSEKLLELIHKMMDNRDVYEKSFAGIQTLPVSHASSKIIQEMFA